MLDEDKTPLVGPPQDVVATDSGSRKLVRDSVGDRMRAEKFFAVALQGLCSNPQIVTQDVTPNSEAIVDQAWDIAIAAANGFAEEGWD